MTRRHEGRGSPGRVSIITRHKVLLGLHHPTGDENEPAGSVDDEKPKGPIELGYHHWGGLRGSPPSNISAMVTVAALNPVAEKPAIALCSARAT